MNIKQFLLIFWAYRKFIIATTASCLVGALIVCAVLPPRWESTARVMLDTIKPDPVTGEVIAGNSTRAYVTTQAQLVTDYTVAGKVAEQVGWLTDPRMIASWRNRPAADKRDFKRYLADMVIANTKATLVEGSNILEIKYTGPSAEGAKDVAEALRKAYLDSSLEFRREDAEHNAAWYTQQMAKAKQALDAAVAAETDFEKANGVVMQANKLDAESARLQALSQVPATMGPAPMPSSETSPSAMQLADVEAQLALAQKTLGPNNPEIQALQTKRAALQVMADRERAASRTAAARMAAGGVAALNQALDAQKAKVISESQKIGRLSVLQQDVELKKAVYERASAKAEQFREEANSTDIGLTPLGAAATPKAPSFPNYWLIVPGALALGAGMGVLVSLLMELFGRRVRSADDLAIDDHTPVICLVPAPGGERTRTRPAWLPRPLRVAKTGAAGA